MKCKLLLILIFSCVLCEDVFLPELAIETCDCGAEVSDEIYMKNELSITPNPAILYEPLHVWLSYYVEFTEALANKLIATNYTWGNFYYEENINFTISVPLLCEKFEFSCIYKNFYPCYQVVHSEELCKMIFDKMMNGGTLTGFVPKSLQNLESGDFQSLWKVIIGILQKYSLKGRLLVSFPKILNAFCMDIDIKVKTSKYIEDSYLRRNAEQCAQPASSQCMTPGRTNACLNGGTVSSDGTCYCPFPYSGLMCQFPCEYGPQNLTSDCKPDSFGHAPACGCNLVWYATKCIKRITNQVEISAYPTTDNKAIDMNWTLPSGSFFPNTFANYEFQITDGDQLVAVRGVDQVMYIEGRQSRYHLDKLCYLEFPDYEPECNDLSLKAHRRYTIDVWLLISIVSDDSFERPKVHLNKVEFLTHDGLPLAPTDVTVLNKSLNDPNGVVLSWWIQGNDCIGVIVDYEIKCLMKNKTSLTNSFNVNEECIKGSNFQTKIPAVWLVDGHAYQFQVRVRTTIGWGPYSKSIYFTFNRYVASNTSKGSKGLTIGAIIAISVVSFLVLALAVGLVIGYIYLRRVQKWNQVYEQLLRLKQRFRARSKMHSPPTFTPPRNPEQEQEYEPEGSPQYNETDFEPTPVPPSLVVSGRTTPKFMRYRGAAQDNIESEESGTSESCSSTSGSPLPMSSGYATPVFVDVLREMN